MDKGIFFRRFFLHPFFSLCIPLCGVFTVLPLYLANFPAQAPGLEVYILLILSVVIQVVTSAFFEVGSVNNKGKVFEVCCIVAAGFLVTWVLGAATEISFAMSLFYGLFWLISFSLHRGLKALEIVEQTLLDCKTKDLKEYIKLQSHMMGDYNTAIKRNQSLFLFLFGLQLALMIAVFFIPLKSGLVFPVLWIVFQILVLCAFFYLNLMKADTIYLSEGLGFQGGRRKKQIYAIVILLVLITIAAIPVSVLGSLLPLSIINMDRLNLVFTDPLKEGAPLPSDIGNTELDLPQTLEQLSAPTKPVIDLIPILYVLGCVGAVFLVFTVIYRFVIYWRPIKRLRRIFSRGWLKRLFAFFADWKESLRVEKEESKRPVKTEELVLQKEVKERKKLILEYRKAFLYLVKWGQKNGCPYSSGTTVREYTQVLRGLVPSAENELNEFYASLYEDCFSGQAISPERKKKILTLVKSILRKKPELPAA